MKRRNREKKRKKKKQKRERIMEMKKVAEKWEI